MSTIVKRYHRIITMTADCQQCGAAEGEPCLIWNEEDGDYRPALDQHSARSKPAVKYGRDHSERLKMGDLIEKLIAAATVSDERFIETIDREFIDGCYGDALKGVRDAHYLKMDIRGLALGLIHASSKTPVETAQHTPTAATHRYTGMFRPPLDQVIEQNYVPGAITSCTCDQRFMVNVKTQLIEHWLLGHFDQPTYEFKENLDAAR